MSGRFYVGEWLVEPEQNRLVRGEDSAKLDSKAIQVLSFLAAHPNEVLTKEQIIGSVWEGAFVSDEVLTTAIWALRKALLKALTNLRVVRDEEDETGYRLEPGPVPGWKTSPETEEGKPTLP